MNQQNSLKELLHTFWKGRWIIIITMLIVLAFTIVGTIVYNNSRSKVSTIITLQWNGSDKGEYPNGTAFNYNNIIDSNIITSALEASDITGINDYQARKEISIIPIIPKGKLAAIQRAIEEGRNDSYYAVDYKLEINSGALGLTVDQTRNLINNIVEEFQFFFKEKYNQQTIISNLTNTNIKTCEYVDAYLILNTQVKLIETTINEQLKTDPNFVSTSLGIGFNDILVRTTLIKEIQLKQISSRINAYNLSRDKEYLIIKYSHDLEMMKLDLAKAKSKELSTQTLITNYEGNTTTIIIPGVDPSQSLKIDPYYDTLIKNMVTIQNQVAELENDISYLEMQIKRLDGTEPNVVTPEKEAEEIAKVEKDINDSTLLIQSIINDSNTILAEHNELTTSSVIKPLMSPELEANSSIILNAIIGLLVSLMIGFVAVYIVYKNPKNNVQAK